MAIRIKSHVYTVIFSIILIVLENWGSIAAQQQQLQQQKATDQNFYFQSPQRFQQPFPASRNGFFPSNGLPNLVQNLPQSLPRSQLGAGIQQPQQQLPQQPPLPQQQQQQQQHQDESAFFGAIPAKNDGSSSDYFQYSAFPQQSPRQPENFFQISPRPFAIQPNGQNGFQFVRPPIVPQPQQYTADQNNGNFPFPQHIPQQRPQLLHPNADTIDQHQQSALHPQPIGHQNAAVSRAPTLTIYDATKFVKQSQASRLLNDSTAHRNSNNNSIRNSVRKSNESVTSQENSSNSNENRFPNTRNRFHPLSTTKQPTSNRATLQLTTPPPPTTATPIISSDSNPSNAFDQRQNRIPISSRFGTSREQNTSVRINKFLRQPTYTSRENQQQAVKRINVTHNGSANRDGANTSKEVSSREHQLQLLQQAREKFRESSGETVRAPAIPLNQGIISKPPQKQTIVEKQPSVETADDEEFFYEDDEIEENPGQVEVKTTIKPKDENKPVILTSNFFLPGKPVPNIKQNDFENQEPNDLSSNISVVDEQDKDNAEDVIDALPEEETEKMDEPTTTKKAVELPKIASTTPQVKPVTEDPNVEYEYEYVDYEDGTTESKIEIKTSPKPSIEDHEHTTLNVDKRDEPETTDELPESDVTARSETKSSTSTSMSSSTSSSTEQIEASIEPVETSSVSTTETAENTVDSTEGYVVASVQTSRSISGARYLTFPQVEQEEKTQLLGAKEAKKDKDSDYNNDHSNVDEERKDDDDLVKSHEQELPKIKEDNSAEEDSAEIESEETSEENVPRPRNDSETTRPENVVSKGHKLSSISEKLAHLHELNEPKPEVTTKSVPVVIRKFSPRTTKTPTRKTTTTTKKTPNLDESDELASLLPPGFKYRAHSFKETTITTSSTTPKYELPATTEKSTTAKDSKKVGSAAKEAILEIGGKQIQFHEISIDSLLPKDFKPSTTSKPSTESKPKAMDFTKVVNESDLLSKIKFDDNIEALLPKDFKLSSTPATTKPPIRLSTVTEDISKFLPPGFKLTKESATTARSLPKTTMDDISKFLPPGYRLPKSTTTEKPQTKVDTESDSGSDDSVLNKLSFNVDISSLLPPGFKANVTASDDSTPKEPKTDANDKPAASGTGSNSSFKLVFPKGIGKRPARLTTPKPLHAEGPPPPGITIRKGLPTRATTEFTGWPTVSTTPLSIERLLQQQGVESIDISEILGKTSSSTSTTVVTTTTTTTTVRPTQPGLCHGSCDLAGTIKIVDGVKWKPELLDHNTVEWKNLAKEVEIQLNDVYSKADRLKKWYKKIRIDSFSQGSVLVDYFVELADVSRDINTQEIKQMFHSALTEVPMTVVPLKNNASSNMEQIVADFPDTTKPARSNYLMGDFILDPLATDFIVIPKRPIIPTTQNEIEQNSIIPQWAIAVIVIGAGSLLFVVIFGAAVLMNRQKRSKKKAPVPLTADMLNELNKNHMGGFENYGNEELYIEDTWDDVKPDFKPKRFANSSSDRDERFDSWRTQQKYQASADYYFDQNLSKPHYSQKSYAYSPQNDAYLDNFHPQYHPSYSNHHQQAHQNAMGLYTYNNRRYNRDYDPDF